MKLFLDCIPCFQKQVLFTVKDLDDKLKSKILRKVMILLCDTSWELTPDEIANKAYNLIREETGIADPYKQIKKQKKE